MKRLKKYKIAYVIGLLILSLSISIVFAEFVFHQVSTVTTSLGGIQLLANKFISYAPEVDYNATDENDEKIYPGGKADASYLNALKVRNTDGIEFEQDSVICYASEREGYNEEIDPSNESGNRNYFYLNQLGFKVSFKTNIDVYIRIHFSDAWILTKTYNGNPQEPEYMLRDEFNIDGIDSDWKYDSSTNTQNYTKLINASSDTQSFSFNIADDYFYNVAELLNGHQSVMVQVSFSVDIIQANRAKTVWGYEPTSM